MFTAQTNQEIQDEVMEFLTELRKIAGDTPLVKNEDGTPKFLNSDGTPDRDAEEYYLYLLKKEELELGLSLALAEHRFDNFRRNTIVNTRTILNEIYDAEIIPNEYEREGYKELLTAAFNIHKMEESRYKREEALQYKKANFSIE